MSNLLKNLLFALGLAVIVLLGYFVFFTDDSSLLESSESTSQAAAQTQEFLVRLQSLREVNIDTNFFTSQTFNSLVDQRRVLVDEPVGRDNPFAPLFDVTAQQ